MNYHKLLIEKLESMETLSVGQIDNKKYDNNLIKFWLSREERPKATVEIWDNVSGQYIVVPMSSQAKYALLDSLLVMESHPPLH